MIAIFKPVNNKPGYDIREFDIKNGKPGSYKWLPAYGFSLQDLPVFKPKTACSSKQEYLEQFAKFSEQKLSFF